MAEQPSNEVLSAQITALKDLILVQLTNHGDRLASHEDSTKARFADVQTALDDKANKGEFTLVRTIVFGFIAVIVLAFASGLTGLTFKHADKAEAAPVVAVR